MVILYDKSINDVQYTCDEEFIHMVVFGRRGVCRKYVLLRPFVKMNVFVVIVSVSFCFKKMRIVPLLRYLGIHEVWRL